MDNLKSLSEVVGEEEAKKILKLAGNYDKYVSKFKKEMNSLISSTGFEVKTGITFIEKEDSSKK